jgi:hypothetical protein
MYEKAKQNVKKAANQIVENLEDITKPKYKGMKYEAAKKRVKTAANQIADNMEEMSKSKASTKAKGYLKSGVDIVDAGKTVGVGADMVEYGVKGKLGKYMEEQVKGVTSGSKKVKIDIK